MKIPTTIVQGDSLTWIDVPQYKSDGTMIASSDWTLTYKLVGTTTLSIVAAASGQGWQTSITTAQSAALAVGTYYWGALASKTGERVTLGKGTLGVEQDMATASAGFDGRTQNQKDLAAVQTEIRARVSGGAVVEYWIGTRRLRKEPIKDLLDLESNLKLKVAKEKTAESIANGLGDPRSVFVRF